MYYKHKIRVENRCAYIELFDRLGMHKGTVIIDEDDLLRIEPYVLNIKNNGYAEFTKTHKYLHRFLMNCPKGKTVDHINGNRLDNRKANLRICTFAENCRNKKATKGKYKGVYKNRHTNRYIAQITKDYKCHHLGHFDSEEEAALAYNKKAIELHGDFAYQNIITKPKEQWKVRKKITLKGEKVKTSKLTKEKVLEIRSLFASGGYSKLKLSEIYGVSHKTVRSIIARETWKHVEEEPFEQHAAAHPNLYFKG